MNLIHLLAQAAVATAPAEAALQQGVTSYGPEFFAAQQPSTAVDDRRYKPGQAFYFRVRKTFGG